MNKLTSRLRRARVSSLFLIATLIFSATLVPVLQAREKDKLSYGEGLIVNVPFTETEVEQVVKDVAQNGVIRGTREYNKDEFVGGATPVDSTHAFPPWTEGGKVFYKVRLQALDPRNFKDGGDVGTLAVRYVLRPQGDKNTVLRIDAIFVEDFRHTAHPSNGSVESSEYKDIKDHLDSIEVMKQQTAEAERERLLQPVRKPAQPANVATEAAIKAAIRAANKNDGAPSPAATTPVPAPAVANAPGMQSANQAPPEPPTPQPVASATVPNLTTAGATLSGEALERHVQDLRRQVERLVKSPGTPLKSAPFHTASTLSALTTGTEVLIVISTPYWYGVETRDGQHGWIFRDALESLP